MFQYGIYDGRLRLKPVTHTHTHKLMFNENDLSKVTADYDFFWFLFPFRVEIWFWKFVIKKRQILGKHKRFHNFHTWKQKVNQCVDAVLFICTGMWVSVCVYTFIFTKFGLARSSICYA